MSVELLQIFGNDLMVCDAARVSLGKEAKNYTEGQNSKLLHYLAKNNHTSPYRHPQIQFRIKCPIYIERQLFTHQIGIARNSISGRYVDFSDTYTYIGSMPPYNWRANTNNIKQGSSGHLDCDGAESANEIEALVIKTCKEGYDKLIELGVCKEQARAILPLCLNTQFIWTLSLQAFIHLCKLRIDSHAQLETREVVEEMLRQVKNNGAFDDSLKAWEIYNLV